MNGDYETRDQRMVKYTNLVKQRLESFSYLKLEHIPRSLNEKEYALAVVAASISIKEIGLLSIYYELTSSITTD